MRPHKRPRLAGAVLTGLVPRRPEPLGMRGDAGYKPGMTDSTSRHCAAAATAIISAAVPESMQGCRLDQALELLLPGEGLRARKRAWERWRVLVDGSERPKGYRVLAGQVLALEPRDPTASDAGGGRPPRHARGWSEHGLHGRAL